ncbi:MAG: DUF6323 family protein [Rummeliibacillus sp.]
MDFNIMNIHSSLIQKQAVQEIFQCNDFTTKYGLSLTEQQAMELVKTRNQVLSSNGRVEFSGGIIHKIIQEFCDSPYITKDNYVSTIQELIEIFYYYKNETEDLVSDDDLIYFMGNAFNQKCQGSLELLSGRELDKIATNLRYGKNPLDDEEADCENEDDDNYGEY